MNKRNKDLLKLNKLFKNLTAAAFSLGRSFINRPGEKVFLKDMRRIEPSLYILKSSMRMNYAVGFRTFYCGVNTYVPPEFKNYWISDHHILSIFYKLGMQSFNLIPYNGNIYTVQFVRIPVPHTSNTGRITSIFDEANMVDGIKNWIELFYHNNDEKILFTQGLVFPKFKLFDRDSLLETVRIYQISCDIKHIANARNNLIRTLENAIASII